jgi:hypothetical protein
MGGSKFYMCYVAVLYCIIMTNRRAHEFPPALFFASSTTPRRNSGDDWSTLYRRLFRCRGLFHWY